jgi:3D (Asp-Asp-Asp) domain-containing protein
MNKRKQILVAVLIAIAITTSTAQAGLLDWFTANNARAEQAQNGSFDQLYASITGPAVTPDAEAPTIMTSANALEGVSSPVGGVSRTTRRTYTVQVSAYTSEVAQTDDSPFITASGTHVRDGVVATNMFPFGTIIKMPKLYGDRIFVVEDRMNKRYQNNVDIWFADKDAALKLGRRTVQIEVIK